MFILLRKRNPISTIPSLFTAQRIHPLLPRFFSSSPATESPDPKTPKFVVSDYLVASFGFSRDKAAKVSRTIAHLKSPENPDSVRCFLKDRGFSDTHIERLITSYPTLLCSDPQNTLDPNLCALRNMGLSTSTMTQIILSDPPVLRNPLAVSRIKFWLDFLDGDQSSLAKAFVSNRALSRSDITRNIAPKITLLQSHGFSNQEIGRIVCSVRRFITSRISGMEDLLNRTEELGFQPGSGMFLQGLNAMICNSRDKLEKKMELLKSFGWSEDELLSALLKAPVVLALSEDYLRAKMNFLLGEAMCDPSYIASLPVILTFSLEMRLKPRHHVLHLLELKGLIDRGQCFRRAMRCTDIQFVDKYIVPHKEEISGLHEAYFRDFLSN